MGRYDVDTQFGAYVKFGEKELDDDSIKKIVTLDGDFTMGDLARIIRKRGEVNHDRP